MDSTGTCPRGHKVEENAVYCTVCWVRLVPEDPDVVAARRRRPRRFHLPFIVGGALLIGAAAGVVLAQTKTVEPSMVAEAAVSAPAASAPAAILAAEPTAAAAQPVTVSQPEAATVADPVIASESACTVAIDGATVPCSVAEGQLVFQVCVPEDTVTLEARSRATENADWTAVSTDAVLGTSDACQSGSVTADVVIDAPDAGTGDGTWRLVARDSAGERIWKSKFVTTLAS